MATTLAAGFALAVQPISAQTITTDATDLTAGEVRIPVSGGAMPAYRAIPVSGGAHPVVLVLHEIFEVHEYIKDVCRRLAKLGYLAIAPELYARQGEVSKLSSIEVIVSQVVFKVPDAQVMSDLDAAAAWAKQFGNGHTDKLGITGFCWGGRIVWLYAAHNPKLRAGVAWYGRLISNPDNLHPKNRIDVVASMHGVCVKSVGRVGNISKALALRGPPRKKRRRGKAPQWLAFQVAPGSVRCAMSCPAHTAGPNPLIFGTDHCGFIRLIRRPANTPDDGGCGAPLLAPDRARCHPNLYLWQQGSGWLSHRALRRPLEGRGLVCADGSCMPGVSKGTHKFVARPTGAGWHRTPRAEAQNLITRSA